MKRRCFLKLLGLTAITAAVAPAAEAYFQAVGPSPEFVAEALPPNELMFCGYRVIADPYCPPNQMFFLNGWGPFAEGERVVYTSQKALADMKKEINFLASARESK